jgi:hypothetical protein
MTLEELVHNLESLVATEAVLAVKDHVEELKKSFLAQFYHLLDEKKEAFLAENPDTTESFHYQHPLKPKFDQLYSQYKARKNAHFNNLQTTDSDPIAQTFPNIIGFERNKFIIFYVALGGRAIKYKILEGLSLSKERTVIDLNTILGNSSSSISISGLTSVYDNTSKTIHLLFWCNNKIFYLSFSSYVESTVDIMPILQLVSGNFNLDKANNSFVYDLNQAEYLVLNNDDANDNGDIPQQRPGIALTSKQNSQFVFAWYKDTNNKIVSKTINPYIKVFDKKVYEVFSQ